MSFARAIWRTPWIRGFVRDNRRLLAVACMLAALAVLLAVLLMACSGYLIGMTAQPDIALFAIMVPMAIVQICGLGRPVARYAERLTSHDWVFRMTSALRRLLYVSQLQRLDEGGKRQLSGDYLSLLSQDIGHAQDAFLRVVIPSVVALTVSIVVAFVFGAMSPLFACVAALVFAISAFLVPALVCLVTRFDAARERSVSQRLYRNLTDDVMGASDWMFSGRGGACCSKHARDTAALDELRMRLYRRRRIARLVIELLFCGFACAVVAWAALYFGGGSLIEYHTATQGGNFVIAFGLAVFPLVETYAALPDTAYATHGQQTAIERISEYVQGHADESAREGSSYSSVHSEAMRSRAATLEFEHVSFSYEQGGKRVLDDVSISVPAGEKLAVLGRSGSGKSTLLALMDGELRGDCGRVLVDGKSVADVDETSAMISLLEQDAFLFNRSLRFNVTLGREGYSDERVLDALSSAGLGEVVAALADGLDTLVGEDGARFSGGQRQRIALARMLLDDAPIVLADEISTGLDPVTEHALFDSLFETLAERTLVVVMHRLAQIDRFDRAIFIEDGKIILDGAPAQLERESELFRRLRNLE